MSVRLGKIIQIKINDNNNNSTSYQISKLKQKNEVKSVEKEKKFFKSVFPKIIAERNRNRNSKHIVTEFDKKVKGISLKVKTYNKYMRSYEDIVKYPSKSYYSTERLNQFVPYSMLNNVNLNRKNFFYSTFNTFKSYFKNKKFLTFTQNKIHTLNQKLMLLSKTNYDKKNIWNFNENFNFQSDDVEVFKYFMEGTFLTEPEKLKLLNIDEKKMHLNPINKEDFDFYSNYLKNIPKNKNFTDFKKKEYEMDYFNNHMKLHSILELKSICLCFEEIDINNLNNKKEDVKDNEKENQFNYFNKEKKKKIQKIYLPFKYLPLFFILSYSSFKIFISEIISYDSKNNKFNIIVNENLEKVVKKYSDYCQNKINLFNNENKKYVFKDIIYYENEFHYNYIFHWIIYNNVYNENKSNYFKLKIIFPLISLKINNFHLKFKKFLNKAVMFELIKNNFISWDRYLLYNLFMNKKLRNIFKYLLRRERNYTLFEKGTKFVGPIMDTTISKKNNFDFFVTDTMKGYNYYYYVSPYKAEISSKIKYKYDLNDTISLQLNDMRKVYKLAKHFGLAGIFNKCLFFNKFTKKYYFSLKFLREITQDIISSLKDNLDEVYVSNKKCINVFKNNGIEYHLVIRECLLCEKIIDINNYSEFKYYKIPNNLFQYLLAEEEIKDDIIFSILLKEKDNLLNKEEIEEYREYTMRKDNIEPPVMRRTVKNKTKRKLKFSSNNSLKKVEMKKTQDLNDKSIISEKSSNGNNGKISSRNVRERKSSNTIIIHDLNELNKPSVFKRSNKKNTTSIGTKFDFKNKFDYKILENIHKNTEYTNKDNKSSEKFLTKITNKSQLELIRIQRGLNISVKNVDRFAFNLDKISSKNLLNK